MAGRRKVWRAPGRCWVSGPTPLGPDQGEIRKPGWWEQAKGVDECTLGKERGKGSETYWS